MSFADDDPLLESANAFTIAPQSTLIETQQDTQPDTIAADTSVVNEGSNAEPLGETKPGLNPETETQQANFPGKRVGRRSMMTAEEKKQDNKLRKLQRKAAVKKAAERAANASLTSDIAGVNASEDPNQKMPENGGKATRQKEQERRKRRRANETMTPQHARQGLYGGPFLRSGGLQEQSTKQAQQSRFGPKRGSMAPDRRYGNTNFRSQTPGQYSNVYPGYGPPSYKRQPPGYYDSYDEGFSGGYNGQGYGQNPISHNQYGDYYGGQYDDYYRQYGGYGGSHHEGQDYGPYQKRRKNAKSGRGDEMITMRKSELTALIEKERTKEREQVLQASAACGDQSMALLQRKEARDVAIDLLYEMLQEAGIEVPELRKREQGEKQLSPEDDRAAILIELLRSGRDQQHTPPPTTSQAHEDMEDKSGPAHTGTTNNYGCELPINKVRQLLAYQQSCAEEREMYSCSATPPRPAASTSADGLLFSSASDQQIAPERSLSVPPNE